MTPGESGRREFLKRMAALAPLWPLAGGLLRAAGEEEVSSADRAIILRALGRGRDERQFRLPIGALAGTVGRGFLGTPYRANTLEQEGEERLVVNLRELDCVTFCETSLAMARSIRARATTVTAYCDQLRMIRYRGGAVDGYGSRLHYFSEWIADNERKGIVRDMTHALGGLRDTRPLDFMTAHRDSYPRLARSEDFDAIAAMERRLASAPRFMIPKDRVAGVEEKIREGDIIAITTSVPGLDVTHTGMAVREGGATRLLHAPNVGQQVQITAGSLADYLRAHGQQSGIMVARPLEPRA